MNFALKSAKAVAKRKAREKHVNGGLKDEMDVMKKKRKKANAGKAEPTVGVVATDLAIVPTKTKLHRSNAAIV
jgi:hypothetical protein